VFTGYQGISTPGEENELLHAASASGPVVSVVSAVSAIDASAPEFQLYGCGVFYSAACSKFFLTQPLVIVGYGAGSEWAF
jgi:hypothetical protein